MSFHPKKLEEKMTRRNVLFNFGVCISFFSLNFLKLFANSSDLPKTDQNQIADEKKYNYYQNLNIQQRSSTNQAFYWETRPYGNPHPEKCQSCEGFISEQIEYKNDGLTKIVKTIWRSREDFLRTLPPEHFEQPMFDNWHRANGISFVYSETWLTEENVKLI